MTNEIKQKENITKTECQMDKKIVLFFEMRRLIEAKITFSPYKGITKTARELYHRFMACKNIDLKPVLTDGSYIKLIQNKRIIKQLLSNKNSPRYIINRIMQLFFLTTRFFVRLLKKGTARSNPSKKFDKAIDTVEKTLANTIKRKKNPSFVLKSSQLKTVEEYDIQGDLYFSPVHPLPPRKVTKDMKRVVTVNDCIYIIRPDFYPLASCGRKPTIKRTLESIDVVSDYVICISESTKNDLMKQFSINEDKIKVIWLAAEEIYFNVKKEPKRIFLKKRHPESRKYILGLGQEEKRKNIITLVKAFCLLVSESQYSDYYLLLVGNNKKLKQRVTRYIQQNYDQNYLNHIRFIRNVDEKKLALLYSYASLFVFPSLYEGFGIPVLEAMAAGCPVILGDNSSLPEVAGNAGYYVNVQDENEVCNGMKTILRDRILRESLIEKGKIQARRFSWDKTAKEVVDFFEQIIKK